MKNLIILPLIVAIGIISAASVKTERKPIENPLKATALSAATIETVAFVTAPEKKFDKAESEAVAIRIHLQQLAVKRAAISEEVKKITAKNVMEQSTQYLLDDLEEVENEIIKETESLIALIGEV